MQLVDPRPSRSIPIRLTPLIDVVFILLVFFMVTSRLLPLGMLTLTNTVSETPTESAKSIPTLVVTESGRIRWNNGIQPLESLLGTLARAGINEVTVATEAQVTLDHFTRTLSGLEAHGITTHWQRWDETTP